MAFADWPEGNLPLQPAQLLPLALSRPQDALLAARSVLASRPSAYDASLARHCIGIVLRDRGDLRAAIAELRKGAALARASGHAEREMDVQATLGVALAWTGRSQQGLAMLDEALRTSHGGRAGQVLMRRATVLRALGRFYEARDDLSRALPYFRREGDTVWEARSLTRRAEVFIDLGLPGRAEADWARAEKLFAANGQELEYAMARHNFGLSALIHGDLPEALAYFDEAGHRYDVLGEINPDLAIDRCLALLTAGLATEAAREAGTALARAGPESGIAYKRAELLYVAATAELAAGNTAPATERARQARRLFQAQERPVWAARAGLVLAQARYAAGERSVRLLRYAEEAADGLEATRTREAVQARVLAGRIALARGATADADRHLDRAARSRRGRPPLTRSVAWLARALQADARGNTPGTLAACARGLSALDEHQMRLGATELRAHGTAHGRELAQLAQREALRKGDARRLLFWSERWRATVLAARRVSQRPDEELAAQLAALRSITRLVETAVDTAGPRRNALLQEQRRLEAAVQARTRHALGPGGRDAGVAGPGAVQDELGDGTLIELVEVDGELYAITITGRRVRLHAVGPFPQHEVEMARFTLRRLAYGRPGDVPMLAQTAARLEASLLGPGAVGLGDGPVVVVPPGSLQAVPWGLMPSLRDRVLSVAPSAAMWVHARRKKAPAGRAALIIGPGLITNGAEVTQLRSSYPDAAMLGHGTATAENVLHALDGAGLAHIAAHGTFRADNPLFSSLLLDDGPLTVHDFERLHRAPHQLILSSCDSAVTAAVGADELLGLVSSLIPLGAAGIVAAVVPVNDLAAVPLMLALHAALRDGATLPAALLAARRAAAGDLLAEATAQSFIAMGA
jgi:tetratricopeptide (TPR) repeat protein